MINFKNMSETKTFVFPNEGNSGSGILGMLAPLMQKNGLDPNLLLAMNNRNNGGFGGEGGWFMWIIFLFFLFPLIGRGGWGNGFGGNDGVPANAGLAGLLNNDTGRELLMSAIQGNGQAINNLATNFNCSAGQIQQAINSVMSQVQQVGNQVGQSSMQIINALQQGNCQIAQQLASCCCENRLAICQQTNTLQNSINSVATGQERGFSSVAYETQRQTCDLQNSIKDSTQQILAGQRAAEMRDMQDKIDKLREENSTFKSSAMTSQIGAQATAPLGAALSDLSSRLAKIECNQPEVAKVPYSPVVGVPACVAAQYGLNYNPYTNGLWG